MAKVRRALWPPLALLLANLNLGCASLTNPVADAIPVRQVSDELLASSKDDEVTTPLTLLALPADTVYRVAAGDVLGIWIEGVLGATNQPPPLHISAAPLPRDQRRVPAALGYPIPVDADGTLTLPLIDSLNVAGLTLAEIRKALRVAYTEKRQILKAGNERILVSLLQPRQIRVLVLRQESSSFNTTPEGNSVPAGKRGTGQIVELAANENDILHALTLSGGLPGLDAYNKVIIFRNGFRTDVDARALMQQFQQQGRPGLIPSPVATIPLRTKCGRLPLLSPEVLTLHEGDVLFLEARDREVFYTAGLLPAGEHILPRDRNLDVLEAIARVRGPLLNGAFSTNNLSGNLIASGIGSPSPSLLVVIRRTPEGGQVPIRVDLNQALRDSRERLVLQAGDLLLLQEHPNEALARYFSQSFFNLSYTFKAISNSTGIGVIDINAAKQAQSKASNKDVKAFADDMVRDHEAVNKQALDLVKKLKVTPEDNDTSRTLSKNAADKLAELGKLSGAAYDKAYVANEVAYHKAVNGALETQLIPSADNAELKSLLQTGLKIFQGHQQHAEHVAAALK